MEYEASRAQATRSSGSAESRVCRQRQRDPRRNRTRTQFGTLSSLLTRVLTFCFVRFPFQPTTAAKTSAASTSPPPATGPSAPTTSPAPQQDEFEHGDPVTMICLLCQRQFKTIDDLRKHNKLSALHKAHRLAARKARSLFADVPLPHSPLDCLIWDSGARNDLSGDFDSAFGIDICRPTSPTPKPCQSAPLGKQPPSPSARPKQRVQHRIAPQEQTRRRKTLEANNPPTTIATLALPSTLTGRHNDERRSVSRTIQRSGPKVRSASSRDRLRRLLSRPNRTARTWRSKTATSGARCWRRWSVLP